MAGKTYSDKLRDPRWQKMRLKVFERDDWTCQSCRDTTTTLHVHHKEYLGGADPWDHPMSCLVTLCQRCHDREWGERNVLEHRLLAEMRRGGIFAKDLEGLAARLLARNSCD